MAFMGRGEAPNIGNNDKDNVPDNAIRRYRYYMGPRYYVPLDNTYVIMQMIVTFIILIVGVITFLVVYKSTIIDPIENIKKLFMNSYLIIIGILLAITSVTNFFSKSKNSLIKRLAIILGISIIIMFVFFGIKLNLDTTYTKERFEQFYTEQNIDKTANNDIKSKIDIVGMSIKTEKEYYVDECLKLYGIFSTKAYATLGLHLLLNILLIYQILKLSKIQGKKEKLNKDDLILFDEQENVKI